MRGGNLNPSTIGCGDMETGTLHMKKSEKVLGHVHYRDGRDSRFPDAGGGTRRFLQIQLNT